MQEGNGVRKWIPEFYKYDLSFKGIQGESTILLSMYYLLIFF